jgi:hypothetical protein
MAYFERQTAVEGTLSSTGSPDARRSRSPPGQQLTETKPKSSGQPTMPPRRTWLWFLVVLAVNFLLARFLFATSSGLLLALRHVVAGGGSGRVIEEAAVKRA